jgi:hypothetical protein
MFRAIAKNVLMIVSLLGVTEINAYTVALQVYKGELGFVVPAEQEGDSLLIRYRSKTREVVRIAINGLALTNTTTNEVTRLHDQAASLSNHYDKEGYWVTDVSYSDLSLGNDNYRIQGRLTLYLIGSQRTRNFSVYLKPEASKKPPNSTIDWGVGD